MEKCKVLHIGSNNNNQVYSLNSRNLQQVLEEKDLGVTFDSRLQFSTHIAACTSKANQRIGLLRRNFKFLDEETFMPLYKALVRPILEMVILYGSHISKRIVNSWKRCREGLQNLSDLLKTRVILLD